MNTDPNLEQLIVETATALGMDNPSEQMLLEFSSTGEPNHGDPSRANVAPATGNQNVYLEGVFLSAKANTDIKFSSLEDMHRAINDYQKQFVETGQGLGELRGAGWVPKATPDPEKAALRVTELTIQPNGDVLGKSVLISPKLRALVLAGWRPVIRVRALGRQSRDGVIQPGFKIMAFDVAWSSDSKSTLNAFGRLGRVNESLNEQQQQPAAATPSADKPRLITVEILSEAVANRQSQSQRMKQWIESCRNNTKF